jgi:DDE domain
MWSTFKRNELPRIAEGPFYIAMSEEDELARHASVTLEHLADRCWILFEPRVINVDRNPAYPVAIRALKREGILPRRVRLRQCKYLNNIVEQDHRSVKKRMWLAKGYGSFQSAWRTLDGIETVNMIRKGASKVGSQGRCQSANQMRSEVVRYHCLRLLSNPVLFHSRSLAHSNFATEPSVRTEVVALCSILRLAL